MGDWVLEMQEDCIYLSREEFAEKHGENFVYIYDEQLHLVEVDECSNSSH